MSRVVARARHLDQPQIAFDYNHLGDCGNTRKAEPGRHLTLIHLTVHRQSRFFRMLHDQQVECRRVGEGAPHHQRVGDRPVGIGEGHGAGLGENTELRQFAAF